MAFSKCLKQLIEKNMAVKQPLQLLFVYLEKAYDSVPLEDLWKALEHYNISNSIIRAIKKLYENSFSKIKIGKQLSSRFYIRKGLRQGCSLSPT
jgi:cobalamin biosynthesis Co2+ chelatase CbiK